MASYPWVKLPSLVSQTKEEKFVAVNDRAEAKLNMGSFSCDDDKQKSKLNEYSTSCLAPPVLLIAQVILINGPR